MVVELVLHDSGGVELRFVEWRCRDAGRATIVKRRNKKRKQTFFIYNTA